ncbi:MAG: tRNA-dihydrouridine synthase family protein [Bacteroidales bacterium]|jgi:tRNA-dihydrouridine synthase|nr:tRNA-dihydrouridine synthase family protein [Bacteroidales bacterium]
MMRNEQLWMAPMLGFNEYQFRNIYTKHFRGLDAIIMPFVTLVEGRNVKMDHIKDVWPQNNDCNVALVPQILGNSGEMFFTMNRRLKELGYSEVNWNLGCPAPRVVSHKRGSGLLPYPETIDQVLETVFQNQNIDISVKLRLGYKSPTEIEKIVPILNRYPLKSIVIHPRIATQIYDGMINLDAFERLLPDIHHPVVYNGDITSVERFHILKNRFPQIDQWMIGRGIFWDPFLPERIKGIYHETRESAKFRFEAFHRDLFDAVVQRSFLERNALNKMKEYWKYFKELYQNGQDIFDKIKYCNSCKAIKERFLSIYNEESFKNSLGYPTS